MPIDVGTAGLVGAGLGFAGGLLSNQASARSVSRQMQFQERMSSTAYQRAVADMRAAGLNPALAYHQGGANSPSGGSYDAQNIGESAARGGGAAASAAAIQAQTRADVALKGASAEKTSAEAAQIKLESLLRVEELKQRVKLTGAQARTQGNEALIREMEMSLMSATWEAQVQVGNMKPQEMRERINLLRREQERTGADATLKRVQALLAGLDVPKARNLARTEGTWWKRNIAPYLGDAKSVKSILE